MFLTTNELRELTGFSLQSKQIAWLKKKSWRFEVDGKGRPKVTRSYFESRIGAGSFVDSKDDKVFLRPNFEALINQKEKGRNGAASSQ